MAQGRAGVRQIALGILTYCGGGTVLARAVLAGLLRSTRDMNLQNPSQNRWKTVPSQTHQARCVKSFQALLVAVLPPSLTQGKGPFSGCVFSAGVPCFFSAKLEQTALRK